DLRQRLHGGGVFRPFGDRLHAQVAGQADDRFDDRHIGRVGVDVDDEVAVDFQHVGRQLFQVGEGGVAGAEVVQRHLHAEAAHLVDEAARVVQVVQRDALGNLQAQAAGDVHVA